MVKKLIAKTLIGLGLAQVLIQPNQMLANEECSAPSCCEPVVIGEPLDPCCISAIYPYPATISLCDGWDFYAQGEFLYLSSVIDQDVNIAGNLAFDQSELVWHFQNSSYRPGFRVSVGADLGSVVLDITYLRYHSHTTSHFSASAGGGVVSTFFGPSLFSPAVSGFTEPVGYFGNVKSTFNLSVDLGIISLQKPVYMGKRLIMNLNYGILALWTGQKFHFTCAALIPPPPSPFIGITSDGVQRVNHKGWAIGPNLGFTATALLPWNLQAIGKIDLSVQYASIYKLFNTSSFPQYPFPNGNNTIKIKGHADHFQAYHAGEIGIGWGDYLACDRYHVNVFVTYNWFNQHIIDNDPVTPQGADWLFLHSYSMHGIAVGGRFDF